MEESVSRPAKILQVGKYRVCLPTREIFCGEKRIAIPWRSFEALQILIEANGDVVDRETFFDRLWPGVSVGESSLNQCMAKLRKDLGEPSEGGVIETVARRGYRLTQTPEPMPAPDQSPIVSESAEVGSGNGTRRHQIRLLIALLTTVVLGAVAISLAWGRWSKRAQARSLTAEGFAYLRENRGSQLGEANTLFRRALELDPTQALAYGGLAEVMARSSDSSPEQARLMAERSIGMDPSCVECKAIAGWILMTRAWRFGEARRFLQEAAAQKPTDPRIGLWNAQMLACTGQLGKSLAEIDRAMALDPTRPDVATMRAGILYLSGRYQESTTAAHQSLGLQPGSSSPYDWLFRSYVQLNRVDEALAAKAARDAAFIGLSADSRFDNEREWSQSYHTGGIHGLVENLLRETSAKPALDQWRYDRAVWKMWDRDKEGAMDELEHVFDFRPFHSIYVAVDPIFAPLRGESRFRQVVSRIGINSER